MSVYVSVTGFRAKSGVRLLRFWWHALRSLAQARRAAGNLKTEARSVDGIYHTMTVWADEACMRAYLRSGAHRRAMTNFRAIGSGKTCGFLSEADPGWDAAYARFQRDAREV